MNLHPVANEKYQQKYNVQPRVITQSPGRVEILGNHTDYNGGFVLTVAIDKYITLHGEKANGPSVTLYSNSLDQETCFPIDRIEHDPNHRWADYIKGVLVELRNLGIAFGGFRALIHGNLPIGEGLSSSAALEAATALFVQAIYPYSMEKMEMALLCKHAENRFVGMPCGILDQFSSLFGQENSMLFLDCDTLEYEVLPVPSPAPSIVLCQSGVKHQLLESEYKTRRMQCEAAAVIFSQRLGREVRFLRDVSLSDYHHLEDILESDLRKRAKHVISENQRVLDGASALKSHDLLRLGQLMRRSHESSRHDFENSCPELDILVEEAGEIDGCYGAKLTGGGFGGSTVNLVAPDQIESFCAQIKERYQSRTGRECKTTVCTMAEGGKVIM